MTRRDICDKTLTNTILYCWVVQLTLSENANQNCQCRDCYDAYLTPYSMNKSNFRRNEYLINNGSIKDDWVVKRTFWPVMTKDEINLRKKFLNDILPVILFLFFKLDFWRLRKGGTSQKVVKLILYNLGKLIRTTQNSKWSRNLTSFDIRTVTVSLKKIHLARRHERLLIMPVWPCNYNR